MFRLRSSILQAFSPFMYICENSAQHFLELHSHFEHPQLCRAQIQNGRMLELSCTCARLLMPPSGEYLVSARR